MRPCPQRPESFVGRFRSGAYRQSPLVRACLRAVEAAGEVDAEVALPELRALVGELRDVVERARVVDENVDAGQLSDDALGKYQGILGHYHLDPKKIDPGPALQWDRIIDGAKKLMEGK